MLLHLHCIGGGAGWFLTNYSIVYKACPLLLKLQFTKLLSLLKITGAYRGRCSDPSPCCVYVCAMVCVKLLTVCRFLS